MNLNLGYEMGAALLKGDLNPTECWSQALARASQSEGPQLHRNVTRIEKGSFPQQLGRLRGQLSLSASGDEPIVVLFECGPHVLVLVANDERPFYGVWNVTEPKFYSMKAEEMYGTQLTTMLTQLCSAAVPSVWLAYFLGCAPAPPPSPVPIATTTTTKKKTVTRKRTAPSAAVSIETGGASEETPVAKKPIPPKEKEEEDQELPN